MCAAKLFKFYCKFATEIYVFQSFSKVALHPLKHLSLAAFSGVQPIGESWSEDCLLALQRRVSNRILRIEIQGAHEGKALVAMIDEASDPQANVAELLISAGYGAPAPVATSSDQQVDQTTAAAEPHGGKCLK